MEVRQKLGEEGRDKRRNEVTRKRGKKRKKKRE
jgi:hypothetical protein